MFATHVPELKVIPSEGTYLLWIDCSELGMNDQTLQTFMIEEAKVGLNAGSSYGEEGKQFMRMNIACPRQTLEEGVKRIIHAVKNRYRYQKWQPDINNPVAISFSYSMIRLISITLSFLLFLIKLSWVCRWFILIIFIFILYKTTSDSFTSISARLTNSVILPSSNN